jgi:sn-glycerol 3-phosphate transport system permease protein
MVERTPLFDIVTQFVLFLGLLAALLPFAIVVIAATHDLRTVNQVPMPLVPAMIS